MAIGNGREVRPKNTLEMEQRLKDCKLDKGTKRTKIVDRFYIKIKKLPVGLSKKTSFEGESFGPFRGKST